MAQSYNYENKQTNKTEIQQAADVWVSIGEAIAKEMRKPEAERGVHIRDQLPKPVSDYFGTFTEKLDYIKGCMPLTEIEDTEGVGALVIAVEGKNGRTRIVEIGRTPDRFNPSVSGSQLSDAGDFGEYTMFVSSPVDHTVILTRYLDKEDLEGVVVEKGQPVKLGDNLARGRVMDFNGGIATNVVGLVEST